VSFIPGGQNLSLHPHLHCIVPAVGYTLDGQWKEIGHSGKYLYPVHKLSEAFKGRFLDSLKRALRKVDELSLFNHLIQASYKAHRDKPMHLSCMQIRNNGKGKGTAAGKVTIMDTVCPIFGTLLISHF